MSLITFKVATGMIASGLEEDDSHFDMSKIQLDGTLQSTVEVEVKESSEESEDSDDFHEDDLLPYSNVANHNYEFFPAICLGVSKLKSSEHTETIIIKFVCPQGIPEIHRLNSRMTNVSIYGGNDVTIPALLDLKVDRNSEDNVWFSERFISQQTDFEFVEEHEGFKVLALKFIVDSRIVTHAAKEEDAEKVLAYIM